MILSNHPLFSAQQMIHVDDAVRELSLSKNTWQEAGK